jgi:hypothetical protein
VTGAWWTDRVLPGVVVSLIWAVVVWFSHRQLWRRIRSLTRDQDAHIELITRGQNARIEEITADQTRRIEEITAAQTATLTAGPPADGEVSDGL